MKYSIVIPAYNSGEWIGTLLEQITHAMESITDDFEIVVVNDCSPKKEIWGEIKKAASRNHHICGINLAYNVGQIKALICGIANAKGDYVITMDDDFQHRPDQIYRLINKMNETDADVVIGQYHEKQDSLLRKVGSKVMNTIYYYAYGKPKSLTSNSFRIMKKDLARATVNYRSNHPQFGPIIFSLTKSIQPVMVEHAPRKYGTSGYTLSKMVHETVRSLLTSDIPFDFFCGLGGITCLISIICAIINAIGNLSLRVIYLNICGLWFLGGIIVFAIGVLGKYIVRSQEELIGPQKYQIAETIGG